MFRHLLIIIFASSLVACASSPKANFYMLNAEKIADKSTEQSANGLAVGVWSVNLPVMLDRSQVVIRINQYEVELAEFHRWVGRLADNMTWLIAHELGRSLQSDHVIISPWPPYRKNDYQLKIDIDRFDGELGGTVVLSGSWSLISAKGDKELMRKVFIFKHQVSGKDYSDMVEGLSQLTVQLAEQIANVIAKQKK